MPNGRLREPFVAVHGRSTEAQTPQKRQNRVLRGCKCAVGVGRGISDSPRQLVNQLQRDTACSTTDSRATVLVIIAGGLFGAVAIPVGSSISFLAIAKNKINVREAATR